MVVEIIGPQTITLVRISAMRSSIDMSVAPAILSRPFG